MILPRGTPAGVLIGPLHDESAHLIRTFTGIIHMVTGEGAGMLLADQGRIIAACYKGEAGVIRGMGAFERMNQSPAFFGEEGQDITLFQYNSNEFRDALKACELEGMTIPGGMQVPLAACPPRLDEARLNHILKQPGVVAVSAFFEGFPVQSFGNADFEQVAAMAEDLLRAGKKMVSNMHIGLLEQMLIETTDGKFIIAPFKDLFVCLYTTPDANLGLIRLALRSLQQEVP